MELPGLPATYYRATRDTFQFVLSSRSGNKLVSISDNHFRLDPNAATLTHSNIWESEPQGIGVDFAMACPGSRAHHASYAAPPHPLGDHNPFSFTREPSFDSSLPYLPPNYSVYRQEPRYRPGDFWNLIPNSTFDSVGIGTTPHGVHLCRDGGQTTSISGLSMPPLEQHYHAPTTSMEPIPHHDMSNFGLPIETPPPTAAFSPEASGYASQASRTGSSGEIDLKYSCEYSQTLCAQTDPHLHLLQL
jgi:hypothetical protein